MSKQLSAMLQAPLRRSGLANVLVLIAGFVLGGPPVLAAKASTQFDVMINLRSVERQSQTGLCDSTGATGGTTQTQTIICDSKAGTDPQLPHVSSLRAKFQGSSYRFISYVTGPAGSVDIYTGAGTSTAFRLVNWADREYIEMTVGW